MIRRTARRVRSTPAYAAARRRAVLALRTSSLAQRAAAAVTGPPRPGGGRRLALPLPPGTAVPADHDGLPLVVVTVLGAGPQEVAATVAVVQSEQVLTGSFRPVFVLDTPALGELRSRGYVGELLVPERSWEQLGSAGSWQDYVHRHVRRVVATYGADLVVPLVPGERAASVLRARLALLPTAV